MKRELYIKEIISEFSILKNKLELLSEINLQDMNIIAEYHVQEILNIVFDLNLKNSNAAKANSVAIDLEDIENSVAVQVTSTSSKRKVQDTLYKFFSSKLDEKFEVLLIFILGKKQNDYKNLKVKEGFSFDQKEQIIDFAKIVTRLNTSPLSKIERVRNILKNDKVVNAQSGNAAAKFRKNSKIKEDITKNLISKKIGYEDYTRMYYDPMFKFIYDCLIIRSINDKAYPNYDETHDYDKSPSWYKSQVHDLYEYGIEVRPYYYSEILVNSKGKWNYLNDRDKNTLPKGLKPIMAHTIQRIPYENVEKLNMVPDPVYGYPTLFTEYKNDKNPFSEEIPCIIGYYNDDKNFRKVHYFELSDKDENL